jgi:hypothetical protein
LETRRKYLVEFSALKKRKEYPNMGKDERAIMHEVAQELGITKSSHGDGRVKTFVIQPEGVEEEEPAEMEKDLAKVLESWLIDTDACGGCWLSHIKQNSTGVLKSTAKLNEKLWNAEGLCWSDTTNGPSVRLKSHKHTIVAVEADVGRPTGRRDGSWWYEDSSCPGSQSIGKSDGVVVPAYYVVVEVSNGTTLQGAHKKALEVLYGREKVSSKLSETRLLRHEFEGCSTTPAHTVSLLSYHLVGVPRRGESTTEEIARRVKDFALGGFLRVTSNTKVNPRTEVEVRLLENFRPSAMVDRKHKRKNSRVARNSKWGQDKREPHQSNDNNSASSNMAGKHGLSGALEALPKFLVNKHNLRIAEIPEYNKWGELRVFSWLRFINPKCSKADTENDDYYIGVVNSTARATVLAQDDLDKAITWPDELGENHLFLFGFKSKQEHKIVAKTQSGKPRVVVASGEITSLYVRQVNDVSPLTEIDRTLISKGDVEEAMARGTFTVEDFTQFGDAWQFPKTRVRMERSGTHAINAHQGSMYVGSVDTALHYAGLEKDPVFPITELEWSAAKHKNWKEKGRFGPENSKAYRGCSYRHYERFQEMAPKSMLLADMPWEKICAEVAEATQGKSPLTLHELVEYIRDWAKSDKEVAKLLDITRQVSYAFESQPGAWLMDISYTKVYVREGRGTTGIEYVALPNSYYGFLADGLCLDLPGESGERRHNVGHIGNIMETLGWIAFEKGRYQYIRSVAELAGKRQIDPKLFQIRWTPAGKVGTEKNLKSSIQEHNKCALKDCGRVSYNGKAGEYCCRTCKTSNGVEHGSTCTAKHMRNAEVEPTKDGAGSLVVLSDSTFLDGVEQLDKEAMIKRKFHISSMPSHTMNDEGFRLHHALELSHFKDCEIDVRFVSPNFKKMSGRKKGKPDNRTRKLEGLTPVFGDWASSELNNFIPLADHWSDPTHLNAQGCMAGMTKISKHLGASNGNKMSIVICEPFGKAKSIKGEADRYNVKLQSAKTLKDFIVALKGRVIMSDEVRLGKTEGIKAAIPEKWCDVVSETEEDSDGQDEHSEGPGSTTSRLNDVLVIKDLHQDGDNSETIIRASRARVKSHLEENSQGSLRQTKHALDLVLEGDHTLQNLAQLTEQEQDFLERYYICVRDGDVKGFYEWMDEKHPDQKVTKLRFMACVGQMQERGKHSNSGSRGSQSDRSDPDSRVRRRQKPDSEPCEGRKRVTRRREKAIAKKRWKDEYSKLVDIDSKVITRTGQKIGFEYKREMAYQLSRSGFCSDGTITADMLVELSDVANAHYSNRIRNELLEMVQECQGGEVTVTADPVVKMNNVRRKYGVLVDFSNAMAAFKNSRLMRPFHDVRLHQKETRAKQRRQVGECISSQVGKFEIYNGTKGNFGKEYDSVIVRGTAGWSRGVLDTVMAFIAGDDENIIKLEEGFADDRHYIAGMKGAAKGAVPVGPPAAPAPVVPPPPLPFLPVAGPMADPNQAALDRPACIHHTFAQVYPTHSSFRGLATDEDCLFLALTWTRGIDTRVWNQAAMQLHARTSASVASAGFNALVCLAESFGGNAGNPYPARNLMTAAQRQEMRAIRAAVTASLAAHQSQGRGLIRYMYRTQLLSRKTHIHRFGRCGYCPDGCAAVPGVVCNILLTEGAGVNHWNAIDDSIPLQTEIGDEDRRKISDAVDKINCQHFHDALTPSSLALRKMEVVELLTANSVPDAVIECHSLAISEELIRYSGVANAMFGATMRKQAQQGLPMHAELRSHLESIPKITVIGSALQSARPPRAVLLVLTMLFTLRTCALCIILRPLMPLYGAYLENTHSLSLWNMILYAAMEAQGVCVATLRRSLTNTYSAQCLLANCVQFAELNPKQVTLTCTIDVANPITLLIQSCFLDMISKAWWWPGAIMTAAACAATYLIRVGSEEAQLHLAGLGLKRSRPSIYNALMKTENTASWYLVRLVYVVVLSVSCVGLVVSIRCALNAIDFTTSMWLGRSSVESAARSGWLTWFQYQERVFTEVAFGLHRIARTISRLLLLIGYVGVARQLLPVFWPLLKPTVGITFMTVLTQTESQFPRDIMRQSKQSRQLMELATQGTRRWSKLQSNHESRVTRWSQLYKDLSEADNEPENQRIGHTRSGGQQKSVDGHDEDVRLFRVNNTSHQPPPKNEYLYKKQEQRSSFTSQKPRSSEQMSSSSMKPMNNSKYRDRSMIQEDKLRGSSAEQSKSLRKTQDSNGGPSKDYHHQIGLNESSKSSSSGAKLEGGNKLLLHSMEPDGMEAYSKGFLTLLNGNGLETTLKTSLWHRLLMKSWHNIPIEQKTKFLSSSSKEQGGLGIHKPKQGMTWTMFNYRIFPVSWPALTRQVGNMTFSLMAMIASLLWTLRKASTRQRSSLRNTQQSSPHLGSNQRQESAGATLMSRLTQQTGLQAFLQWIFVQLGCTKVMREKLLSGFLNCLGQLRGMLGQQRSRTQISLALRERRRYRAWPLTLVCLFFAIWLLPQFLNFHADGYLQVSSSMMKASLSLERKEYNRSTDPSSDYKQQQNSKSEDMMRNGSKASRPDLKRKPTTRASSLKSGNQSSTKRSYHQSQSDSKSAFVGSSVSRSKISERRGQKPGAYGSRHTTPIRASSKGGRSSVTTAKRFPRLTLTGSINVLLVAAFLLRILSFIGKVNLHTANAIGKDMVTALAGATLVIAPLVSKVLGRSLRGRPTPLGRLWLALILTVVDHKALLVFLVYLLPGAMYHAWKDRNETLQQRRARRKIDDPFWLDYISLELSGALFAKLYDPMTFLPDLVTASGNLLSPQLAFTVGTSRGKAPDAGKPVLWPGIWPLRESQRILSDFVEILVVIMVLFAISLALVWLLMRVIRGERDRQAKLARARRDGGPRPGELGGDDTDGSEGGVPGGPFVWQVSKREAKTAVRTRGEQGTGDDQGAGTAASSSGGLICEGGESDEQCGDMSSGVTAAVFGKQSRNKISKVSNFDLSGRWDEIEQGKPVGAYMKLQCDSAANGEPNAYSCVMGKQSIQKALFLPVSMTLEMLSSERWTCSLCGKELSNKELQILIDKRSGNGEPEEEVGTWRWSQKRGDYLWIPTQGGKGARDCAGSSSSRRQFRRGKADGQRGQDDAGGEEPGAEPDPDTHGENSFVFCSCGGVFMKGTARDLTDLYFDYPSDEDEPHMYLFQRPQRATATQSEPTCIKCWRRSKGHCVTVAATSVSSAATADTSSSQSPTQPTEAGKGKRSGRGGRAVRQAALATLGTALAGGTAFLDVRGLRPVWQMGLAPLIRVGQSPNLSILLPCLSFLSLAGGILLSVVFYWISPSALLRCHKLF